MLRYRGAGLVAPLVALVTLWGASVGAQAPADVMFTGPAQSSISFNVAVPANRAYLWTSGTVPPVLDATALIGSRAKYGDTKTQGEGILRTIEAQLKARGLTLKDVVYLRVYIAPDKAKNGQYDFPGWFAAYAEFFGNATNATKVARSTVGVGQLVDPDWLIEIEAVAVFPPSH